MVEMDRAGDVLAKLLRLEQGTPAVPRSPGLGITLENDKVESNARQYQERDQYYNFPVPGRS